MNRNQWKFALAVIGAIHFSGFASNAIAKSAGLPNCTPTIAACGCAITKSGAYTISVDLTGSPLQDCIDISAAKVNLRSNGHILTGSGGTGIGINVLKSAANANLQLADPQNPDSLSAISNFAVGIAVQGGSALLNGFDVSGNQGDGLQISGSNCSVSDFFADNSNSANGVTVSGASCQLSDFTASGNANVGVALIKAKSNVLTNFSADDSSGGANGEGGVTLSSSSSNTLSTFSANNNGGPGVMLSNSSKNVLFTFDAGGNAAGAGIELSGSATNSIFDFSALDNATYGVWLAASSSNSVRFGLALGNTQAGVYLGCDPANGPIGAACSPAVKASSKNTVTAILAGDDPGAGLPQAWGIAVDLGDLQNNLSGNTAGIIAGVTATGDTLGDLEDENSNCGTNLWFANFGAVVSPACTAL